MVFQLFGVFKCLLAYVTFELFDAGVDFHMGVVQTGQNGRFEGAFGAAVELHVNVMLTPEVCMQRVPVPVRVFLCIIITFGT